MAAPRSPVATPSSGSRWLRSIGVTVSRRSPRVEPTKSATKSSAGWPSSSAGVPNCASRPPVGEHRDPVAHPHGLVDVVGDEHDGLAELALQPQELVLQADPHDGSTAPNGSSISSTGGSAASARATPTRCCWPPESWCG